MDRDKNVIKPCRNQDIYGQLWVDRFTGKIIYKQGVIWYFQALVSPRFLT